MQLLWIGVSVITALVILNTKPLVFYSWSYITYIGVIILLVVTLFVAPNIKGSHSWLVIGSFSLQPAEFAKTATALLFAKQLSHIQTDIRRFKDLLNVLVIIVVPCFLIILQPDPGSTLVYGAFIFALNREGMSSSFVFLMLLFLSVFLSTLKFGMGNTITFFSLLTCIYGYWVKKQKGHIPYKNVSLLVLLCVLTSFSANFIFYNVFKQHHRDRFSLWLRLENEITDSQTLRQTVAYNTLQAE